MISWSTWLHLIQIKIRVVFQGEIVSHKYTALTWLGRNCSLIGSIVWYYLPSSTVLLLQDFQSTLQWQFECVEKITPEQDCILYATSDNIQDNQQCFTMREVEVWKYASII